MDPGHTAMKNSQSVNICDIHEEKLMTFIAYLIIQHYGCFMIIVYT